MRTSAKTRFEHDEERFRSENIDVFASAADYLNKALLTDLRAHIKTTDGMYAKEIFQTKVAELNEEWNAVADHLTYEGCYYRLPRDLFADKLDGVWDKVAAGT